MEVKIDGSHKKIDLRKLDLKKAKELGIKVGATLMTLFMLSGCGKKKAEEHVNSVESTETSQEIVMEDENFVIEDHDPNEEIGLYPITITEFDDNREIEPGKRYTYDDLAHATSCYFVVSVPSDYEGLNYIPNVKHLTIFDTEMDLCAKNVDGSRLAKGININILPIYSSPGDWTFGHFSEEKYGFLKDIEDIDTLIIGNHNEFYMHPLDIDSEFLQSLTQVHNLSFMLDRYSSFQYSDLTFLDSLTISGKPYDIAMYLSTDNIKQLEDSGVKIDFSDSSMAEIKDINKQIDEIVDGLNVDSTATVQEKLNAVLTYVLTEYKYDKNVAVNIQNDTEIPDETYDDFYGKGDLQGALANDSQICGNYAAMTTALLNRLGVKALNVYSLKHAFVAVELGDYYFYVDPTFLDSDGFRNEETTYYFQNGLLSYKAIIPRKTSSEDCFSANDLKAIGSLKWYLMDPTELPADDISDEIPITDSHDLLGVPSELDIKPIPDKVENKMRYTNVHGETIVGKEKYIIVADGKDVFEVSINGKQVKIGAAAFVGVLTALGLGILVHKIKQKKVDERAELNEMFYDKGVLPTPIYEPKGLDK